MIQQLKYLCKENSVFRYMISFFIIGLVALLIYSSNSSQQQAPQPSITHNQQKQSGGSPNFSIFKIF